MFASPEYPLGTRCRLCHPVLPERPCNGPPKDTAFLLLPLLSRQSRKPGSPKAGGLASDRHGELPFGQLSGPSPDLWQLTLPSVTIFSFMT